MGAGVAGIELHIDCVLDLIEGGRESGKGGCFISGASSASSTIELGFEGIGSVYGWECKALARRSEAVDFIVCERCAVCETSGDGIGGIGITGVLLGVVICGDCDGSSGVDFGVVKGALGDAFRATAAGILGKLGCF